MPRAPKTTSIKSIRVSASSKTKYYCEYCNDWKTDYNRHYNELHAKPEEKTRFMCPFEDKGCKVSSGQRHNLNRHIRQHLNLPLHCSICAESHWGEDTLSRHYLKRHNTSLAEGHGQRIICPWIANEEAGVPAYTKQPREVPLSECPVERRGQGKGPYKKKATGREARAPSPPPAPAPTSTQRTEKSPSPVLDYQPPLNFPVPVAPTDGPSSTAATVASPSSLVNATSLSSSSSPNVVHSSDELFPELQLQYPDPSATFLSQLPEPMFAYSTDPMLSSSSASSAYSYGTDPMMSSFSSYIMDPTAAFSSIETQWSNATGTQSVYPSHEPMPSGYSMFDFSAPLLNFGDFSQCAVV